MLKPNDTDRSGELIVGILGGMGPYASLDFFKRVLENTAADKDWEHLHVVMDSNPKIPSRTRAFLFGETSPVPLMVESANRLKAAGADLVVLPCNSAHYFLPEVKKLTDVPILDMIEVTCAEIVSLGVSAVGILAGEVTVEAKLYERILEPQGISVLQVSSDDQKEVRVVIEDVKQNRVDQSTQDRSETLIKGLQSRGADAVVLGCTELPIALQGVSVDGLIVDTTDVLAKASVSYAKGVYNGGKSTELNHIS